MKSLLEWLDRSCEHRLRTTAQRISRRSALVRIGGALVGGAFLPMLPFDRARGADGTSADTTQDESSCDYWAYCAMNGTRCSACGGSNTQCPPGTQASLVSWVGTCINPRDKKTYLVSYNDCCGKGSCDAPKEMFCSRHEGEHPGYRIGLHNDANWCMANQNLSAHCTVAIIIGAA